MGRIRWVLEECERFAWLCWDLVGFELGANARESSDDIGKGNS